MLSSSIWAEYCFKLFLHFGIGGCLECVHHWYGLVVLVEYGEVKVVVVLDEEIDNGRCYLGHGALYVRLSGIGLELEF